MHRLSRYQRERQVHKQRWVGALQHPVVPLRFVNGPEDPVSGEHMAQVFSELVPDPDVVLLEGIGHYPQVEAPERVLSAWRDFIGRCGSG